MPPPGRSLYLIHMYGMAEPKIAPQKLGEAYIVISARQINPNKLTKENILLRRRAADLAVEARKFLMYNIAKSA